MGRNLRKFVERCVLIQQVWLISDEVIEIRYERALAQLKYLKKKNGKVQKVNSEKKMYVYK